MYIEGTFTIWQDMSFEAGKKTCKEYKAKNVPSAEWSNQIFQNNIVIQVVIFYLILLAYKLKKLKLTCFSFSNSFWCLYILLNVSIKNWINKLYFCVCISGKGLIFDTGEFWDKGVEQFKYKFSF